MAAPQQLAESMALQLLQEPVLVAIDDRESSIQTASAGHVSSRACSSRRGVVSTAAAAAAATAAVFGREHSLLATTAFSSAASPTQASSGRALRVSQPRVTRAAPIEVLSLVQTSTLQSEANQALRGGAALATFVALASRRRWRLLRRHISRVQQHAGPLDRSAAQADEPGVLPPTVTPPVAMHEKDQPGITVANEVIQNRLLAEPQYQAVLNLAGRHLEKFSVVNMVTALHMCATTARDHELLKRQIIADPNFVTLINKTRSVLMEDISAIPPRTLSDFMWGCAHLSIFDSDLFNAITADASRRLHLYSATGISLVVFALGVLKQQPRQRFIQALVREFRSRIHNEFDPKSVTMVVYGMMRLGIKDERLMRSASEAMRRTNLDDWDPLSVCCMAYAYTKLEYRDDAAYKLMGRKTLEQLAILTPHQIAMVAMSFAKVSGVLEESTYTMEGIQRGVSERLDEFTNRDLTTYCFAVGKYRQLTTVVDVMQGIQFNDDDPIAQELLEQVDKRGIEKFSMMELNLINYSLMRLRFRNEDFLEQAARQFIKRAQELTSVELINCMYAFAKLEYVHIQFIIAMLEEVKRRNMLQTMEKLEIATLAYSLAVCRVRDDTLMDEISKMTCESVREMEPQSIAMVVWAMAVTNSRANADALASAVLEDMARRIRDYHPVAISCVMWGCAILAGSASALSQLKVIFSKDFWTNSWESPGYAMMYYMMTTLQAEEGLQMQDVSGWYACRRIYEELTGQRMGIQNSRLSERLRIHQIPHLANAMVPTLEGFRNAGVRSDIVIERLKLIIEVEGPQRMTVPLAKIKEQIEDKDLIGRPDDVLSEARSAIECNLTGSASWKRRLLRRCGWKVVTVSFDENEEYIADALERMSRKEKESAPMSEEDMTQQADPENDASFSSQGEPTSPEDLASPLDQGFFGDVTFDADNLQGEGELTKYEKKLRRRHESACKELGRRVEQERGNAAATSRYGSHLDYRKWQVGVEKQVLKEMLEKM